MRNPLICRAIRNRRLLRFHYKLGARTVEPHAYGITRESDEVLRAYQRAGGSRAKGKSRKYTGWKIFRVQDISRLTLLEQTFARPRPGYEPNDESMTRIYCRL